MVSLTSVLEKIITSLSNINTALTTKANTSDVNTALAAKADAATIQAALNGKLDLTRGTAIAQNSNLNDLKTIGSYYSNSGDISSSLSNCPVNVGFVLKVIEGGGSTAYKFQILIPQVMGKVNPYIRYYRSNEDSWYTWTKLGAEEVRNMYVGIPTAQTYPPINLKNNFSLHSEVLNVYQVTCCRYSVDTDTNTGLYIIKIFNNGVTVHTNICSIKQAAGITINCTNTVNANNEKIVHLDITTSVSNMGVSITQLI